MACCGMNNKRIPVPPIPEQSLLVPEETQQELAAVEASGLVRRAHPVPVSRKSNVVPKVFPTPRRSPILPE